MILQCDKFMNTSIVYNTGRHSVKERVDPGISHSRYVHLRLLLGHVKYILNKYFGKNKDLVFVDLGCGEMPYRPMIEPQVAKYIGVDIPGNPKADSYVDLDSNQCDLPPRSADVVWSVGVLEHVEDVEKYLAECHRLLKPKGKLMLCTHGIWMYHPDPIDFWRFTGKGLETTIERSGFEIVENKGIMALLPTSLQLFQDAVLLSFPLVKYWKTPFCFVMQRLISAASFFTKKSKTLTEYQNKEACLFFVVASKN